MDKNIKYILNVLQNDSYKGEFKSLLMSKYMDIYLNSLYISDLAYLNKLDVTMLSIAKKSEYNFYFNKFIDFLPIDAQKIIFLNGFYCTTTHISDNIEIKTFLSNREYIFSKLDSFYTSRDYKYLNFYSIINYIFYVDGLYMFVPNNVCIKKPVYILNFFDKNEEKCMVNNRLFLSLGKNAKADIFHYNINVCNSSLFNNINISILLDSNAVMNYCYVDKSVSSILNSYSLFVKQFKSSFLKSSFFSFGECLRKMNCKFLLEDSKSNVNIKIARCLTGSSKDDTDVDVFHNFECTNSNIIFRSLTDDVSQCIFNGNINVGVNVKNVIADLTCNGLLLSSKSQVTLVPKLCIENNDVKCSHGATIGYIDPDIVLYMMSRGILKKECIDIIINTFLSICLEKNNIFHDILNKFVLREYFV